MDHDIVLVILSVGILCILAIAGWVEAWLQSDKRKEAEYRKKKAEDAADAHRDRWYIAMESASRWRKAAVSMGVRTDPWSKERISLRSGSGKRDRNKCDSIW